MRATVGLVGVVVEVVVGVVDAVLVDELLVCPLVFHSLLVVSVQACPKAAAIAMTMEVRSLVAPLATPVVALRSCCSSFTCCWSCCLYNVHKRVADAFNNFVENMLGIACHNSDSHPSLPKEATSTGWYVRVDELDNGLDNQEDKNDNCKKADG